MLRWRKNQQFRGGVGKYKKAKLPEDLDVVLPVITPSQKLLQSPHKDMAGATWLGHASMLTQWDGWNVLSDPLLSERCSAVQWLGPKRFRPAPLTVDELPDIDVVLISHTHYDHLDSNTVTALAERTPSPLFFVPLGTKTWLTSYGVCDGKIVEMDWSEEAILPDCTDKGRPPLKVACLPCQHWSARMGCDGNEALWAAWTARTDRFSYYFGGDSGYCGKMFRMIGDAIGRIDLAAIPIGAYGAPFQRYLMKPQHMDPEEAANCHRDIKAANSIGIHWGTFRLTDEPVTEPRKRLAAAMEKLEAEVGVSRFGGGGDGDGDGSSSGGGSGGTFDDGGTVGGKVMRKNDFTCISHGETKWYPLADR